MAKKLLKKRNELLIKRRRGGKIIYSEKIKTLKKALQREREVKKWPRAKKLQLLNRRKIVIKSL